MRWAEPLKTIGKIWPTSQKPLTTKNHSPKASGCLVISITAPRAPATESPTGATHSNKFPGVGNKHQIILCLKSSRPFQTGLNFCCQHPKPPTLPSLHLNTFNKLPKFQGNRMKHRQADAQGSIAKEINFPSLHKNSRNVLLKWSKA